MAFTSQVILDNDRNYVINVVSTGGDAAALLIDVSALAPPCVKLILIRAQCSIAEGGLMTLLWDATTPVAFFTHAGGNAADRDFRRFGGIPDPLVAAGATGDVKITTTAFAGSYQLEFLKVNIVRN